MMARALGGGPEATAARAGLDLLVQTPDGEAGVRVD